MYVVLPYILTLSLTLPYHDSTNFTIKTTECRSILEKTNLVVGGKDPINKWALFHVNSFLNKHIATDVQTASESTNGSATARS